jgi:hypothetical protein
MRAAPSASVQTSAGGLEGVNKVRHIVTTPNKDQIESQLPKDAFALFASQQEAVIASGDLEDRQPFRINRGICPDRLFLHQPMLCSHLHPACRKT